jgi:carbamoyl-phosphate synthase large subunit
VQVVVNTPLGRVAHADGVSIRQAAIRHRVPLLTTLSAAAAAISAIRGLRERPLTVRSLQDHYAKTNPDLAHAAWWGEIDAHRAR